MNAEHIPNSEFRILVRPPLYTLENVRIPSILFSALLLCLESTTLRVPALTPRSRQCPEALVLLVGTRIKFGQMVSPHFVRRYHQSQSRFEFCGASIR